MKLNSIAMKLALMGAAMAFAPASTAEEPVVRTSEREPLQVAALMRGFAAGNGWTLAQEMSANNHAVIALRLCSEAEDGEPAMLCGQFAILGNGDKSDVILLHAEETLAPQGERGLAREAMKDFTAVLDAVAPPANVAEGRFICDATGCP